MALHTKSNILVSPIWIGSRHLGWAFNNDWNGNIQKDSSIDWEKELEGVLRTIRFYNSNYIDACHHYGYGSTVPLLAQALKNVLQTVPREYMRINGKLEVNYSSREEIIDACDRYCDLLNINYLDSYQIHAPMHHVSHKLVVETVLELIKNGKVRHLSVSNFNTEQLDEITQLYGQPPISHEVHYNLVTRVNEENGVLDWWKKHGVQTIVYQPLRRNQIAQANYPLLTWLAEEYQKTQNQILLNRLCVHKWYNVLNKSTNPDHIRENHTSLKFRLSDEDYALLDAFRPVGYQSPEYDYRWNDASKPKIRKL